MQSSAYPQSHSRRAPSSSSVASSGTAYSSTRGSYAGSASGGGGNSTAHLESTVTKLLVSTKQLLEGLTDWSLGKISEEQVSDIYVRLGNCFNAAVAAFTREGINMRFARCLFRFAVHRLNARSAGTSRKCPSCFEFAWRLLSTRKQAPQPYTNICRKSGQSSWTCCAAFAKSRISIKQCWRRKRGLQVMENEQHPSDMWSTTRQTAPTRQEGKTACPRNPEREKLDPRMAG